MRNPNPKPDPCAPYTDTNITRTDLPDADIRKNILEAAIQIGSVLNTDSDLDKECKLIILQLAQQLYTQDIKLSSLNQIRNSLK